MLCDSETLFLTVQGAGQLAEALSLLEARKFDAVLADVGGRGDAEVANLSKLLARASETPVILTTSAYEKERALEAVRAGAQDYVQKSQLNAKAIERILLYAIERHRARTRAEMQYKKLEVELRVAQKLDAVGRLAAGIAHEINTPIQFVGDNAHFLQDAFRDGMKLQRKYEQLFEESGQGLVPEQTRTEVKTIRKEIDWSYLESEVPKAIEQVLDGVDRVATIVRAMKEFSHVDQSADKTAADLNKALESILVVARNEVKYIADVETDFGPLSPVVCHLGDLNQVFLNLLINAAHAIGDVVEETGSKGQIRIRTRQDGDWVQVDIQDTGTGIPEQIRDKIFDPFFTTKRVGEGTGQGLALAHAIVVEKHGGTLTFETTVGKGTAFHVRLPANGEPAAKGAAAS